jgi:tRNA (guanine-N7-)-methyltransferase
MTDTDETEFGVPFPGTPQPKSEWTQTGLKRLPLDPFDWPALFGRSAPVVVDLGCGNGRFLIGSAVARPDHDHLGLDVLPVVIRYAVRRANQRGLANVRFTVGDARDVAARLLPPQSVTEIHLYHPQPFYDLALVHRRLVTPEFVVRLHRALAPGGLLVVQTDNPGYWRYLRAVLPLFFTLTEHPEPWPDAPLGRTRREILAQERGLTVYRGEGRPLPGLDAAEARRRAESLPLPVFDADRRLRDLDELA